MATPARLAAVRRMLAAVGDRVAPIGPLLARFTVGIVFAGTGWDKLHNLDGITAFFTKLGIPWPHFNAVLVSTTELVGGSLLVAGLLARLACVPLAIVMIVAIATAKWEDVESLHDLLNFKETVYLAIFIWIGVAGPGRFALDHLLGRALAKRLDDPPPA